ncbi:MAG TPA: hypothetical protein VGD17_12120 [Chitinophagaceae bacterium]
MRTGFMDLMEFDVRFSGGWDLEWFIFEEITERKFKGFEKGVIYRPE